MQIEESYDRKESAHTKPSLKTDSKEVGAKPPILSEGLLPQEAKLRANQIAMAPFVFQASVAIRDFGILKALADAQQPLSFSALLDLTGLSPYSLDVLLEAGKSIGILSRQEDLCSITRIGYFLERDPITRVNMDFSQDVCYQGLSYLKESLKENEPEGLKVFGNWSTIYEGLSKLPEKARQSWLAFDHLYSDEAFPRAIPYVFRHQPRTVLDVGGNTGKFARLCIDYDRNVEVTIVDHPEQIELAKEKTSANVDSTRIHYFGVDLLNDHRPLPQGFDSIWMSQFLDCFGPEDIVQILARVRNSMRKSDSLFVMEPLIDKQKFETSEFCLNMTSLYFTAMANGKSRMYRCEDFHRFFRAAKLKIVDEVHALRVTHSLFVCQRDDH